MRAPAALAALAAVLVASCGGGGLREPEGCPPFEPPPAGPRSAYATAVTYGLEQLLAAEDAFRLAWPDRRLRERERFRRDFVAYAHAMRCFARATAAVEPGESAPVAANFPAFDQFLEGELAFVLETIDLGWEAVESRNRNKYREFHRTGGRDAHPPPLGGERSPRPPVSRAAT